MGTYFGTDGLRGVYGEEITPSIAFKCGNSLSRHCTNNKKVLIGKDTRVTGDILSLSLANGLMQNGVSVIDVGVTTTPAVAYLTKLLNCDFGVVISASHNPPHYNGIKIFDCDGYKISQELENDIERKFMLPISVKYSKIGRYDFTPQAVNLYIENIIKNIDSLEGLKIVLDCGNGASYKIAKNVFSKLKAKVILMNAKPDGLSINMNCGALYPESMSKKVLEEKANLGLSFDGDADRVIACDENGKLIDGDEILYILANYFKGNSKFLVGTSMTNKGLENALSKKGITLLRADVGDKYVVEIMKNKNILLGGEPSGHIIVQTYSTTGDGVLTGLLLANIIKKSNQPISKLIKYKKFPQVNINVEVIDKYRILNSDKLASTILNIQQQFSNKGRVLVRASGTESKVRIMCEHISKTTALKNAQLLQELIKELNNQQKT